jgi:hypothetical protein
MPQEAREALRAYLVAQPLPLPRVVDTGAAPAAGEGWVVPGFERGAVLLRAEDGKLVRLSWEGEASTEDANPERRRALAPGSYALAGYRLQLRDAQGKSWHVSASAVKGVTLDVQAGRASRLEIEPTIRISEKAQSDGLNVSVQGVKGAGLTIYKEGKRIPLAFRRLDGEGRVLGEGKIQYG